VVEVKGTQRQILAARFCCSAPRWLLFLRLDGGSLCCSASLNDAALTWVLVFAQDYDNDNSSEIEPGFCGSRDASTIRLDRLAPAA
jgi:hypothetical protein